MNQAKVSIIATFYNLEDYAKRCVDSISSQTFQDIEIICINDGSKDNTIGILQELAKSDNRIKIIDKKNEGVSVARNTGINAASGKYIMFVDGDDYLEPNACEILYKKAIETDVDIIYFKKRKVKNNGEIKKEYKDKYDLYKIKNKIYLLYDKMVEICDITFYQPYCWNKLYKRLFLKNNNIYFPKYLNHSEDCIFLGLCLKYNPKILLLDYCFYNHYILTKNSLTKVDKYSLFLAHLNAISYSKNLFIIKTKQDEFIKLKILDYLINIILSCWSVLYFSKHKKYYLDEVKNCLKIYKEFDNELIKHTLGYQKIKKYLLMDKYHLLGIYLSVLRPICKYCIGRPYRFIKNCFKS